MLKNTLLLCFGMLIISACGGSGGGGGYACPTVITYANGVTITGQAVYQYRDFGNQAIDSTPNPIRQAEVQVYNNAGSLIQCARTLDDGHFSFVVPTATTADSVRVVSRISNSTSQIGVFNDPVNRQLHSIETTFTPSGNADVGVLTAQAATNTDMAGGAFNILDKVYSANQYIISATASCNSLYSQCTPITSIPVCAVYWEKGVDPGTYINNPGLSYYLTGHSELYILGGDDGDVDNSDTDQFDDAIIVHEYGHFIVEKYSNQSSPLGSHDGNSIIDPRLAWSEGVPDFFQAAVRNYPEYRDTTGNVDAGTASVNVLRDLETPDFDVPSTMGEGNFREFSIARYLWDVIDTPTDSGADTVVEPFAEIWTLLTSTTVGLKGDYHFVNAGLFSKLQAQLGASDWSSAQTNEKQLANENDYVRLAGPGSCGAVTITAANRPAPAHVEDGTAAHSNLLASNDFYKIHHNGGSFNLGLTYTPTTRADLDLYLYKEAYVYGDSSTYAATPSVTRKTASNDNAMSTETISTTLPAGWYVINIRVYTGLIQNGSANYTMTLNGAALCPN